MAPTMTQNAAGTEPRTGRGLSLITIGLLVLLQVPWPGWLFPGDALIPQVLRELMFWMMAAVLIFYVVKIERRSASSIGFRWPDWRTVAFGVGGAIAMIGGMAFIYLVVFPALAVPEEKQLDEVIALPLWFRIALVTRAAVFEELFYRGFAIERVTELTGARWLAAIASLTAFTVAHLAYWGWAHLLVAAYGGLVLTALYLWRRDLGSNMLAHWLTDAVGFILV